MFDYFAVIVLRLHVPIYSVSNTVQAQYLDRLIPLPPEQLLCQPHCIVTLHKFCRYISAFCPVLAYLRIDAAPALQNR